MVLTSLIAFIAKDIVKNKELMDVIIYYFKMDRVESVRNTEIKEEITGAIQVLNSLKSESNNDEATELYDNYIEQMNEIKINL